MKKKERRLKDHEKAPPGKPDCPKCSGYGYDLGVEARFDIRVVCTCVEEEE